MIRSCGVLDFVNLDLCTDYDIIKYPPSTYLHAPGLNGQWVDPWGCPGSLPPPPPPPFFFGEDFAFSNSNCPE